MPARTSVEELSTIRATLRRLRAREAEILNDLRPELGAGSDLPALPRPGWPIQRLSENRAR